MNLLKEDLTFSQRDYVLRQRNPEKGQLLAVDLAFVLIFATAITGLLLGEPGSWLANAADTAVGFVLLCLAFFGFLLTGVLINLGIVTAEEKDDWGKANRAMVGHIASYAGGSSFFRCVWSQFSKATMIGLVVALALAGYKYTALLYLSLLAYDFFINFAIYHMVLAHVKRMTPVQCAPEPPPVERLNHVIRNS